MTAILLRLRWALTLAIAVAALLAAQQSFINYRSHGLGLGLGAVVALVFVLLLGLASLTFARLRVGRELAGLQTTPATGSLFTQRRQRLDALRAAGARPDLDALADATAAVESGRAYLGRYFVATTVLVGLVGTFAGLMETMGQVAPLLSAKDSSALALMAGPLSGLHVTFGASLVAILVTMALALAQGDLVVAETQMLALLEDRTRHELVPALWPAADEPAERTVRALVDLEKVLAAAITKSMQGVAQTVGKTAGAEVDRLGALLQETVARIEKSVETMVVDVARTLAETGRNQIAAHKESLSSLSATLQSALSKSLSETQTEMVGTRASVTTLTDELRALTANLAEEGRTHAEALRSTSRQLVEGLDRGILSSGAALDKAAAGLAEAATIFAGTANTLSPTLVTLAAEIAAVAREVALLAAKSDDDTLSATLVAELDRVGAGVEDLRRLAALANVRLPAAEREPVPPVRKSVTDEPAEATASEDIAS